MPSCNEMHVLHWILIFVTVLSVLINHKNLDCKVLLRLLFHGQQLFSWAALPLTAAPPPGRLISRCNGRRGGSSYACTVAIRINKKENVFSINFSHSTSHAEAFFLVHFYKITWIPKWLAVTHFGNKFFGVE